MATDESILETNHMALIRMIGIVELEIIVTDWRIVSWLMYFGP